MEPIRHQIQKLHLMEEERSPSPLKNKLTDILPLKAIRNHPTGPTRGNIITLTNSVKQPRDLTPQLGVK
jgi:hypothetical protein